MKTDSELKRDVEEELQWDPEIDATDIAVSVKSGVVSLTGFTHSFADKVEAETITKRIAGVHGVANDIVLRVPTLDERPDPEIARDAIRRSRANFPLRGNASRCWSRLVGSRSKAKSNGTIRENLRKRPCTA